MEERRQKHRLVAFHTLWCPDVPLPDLGMCSDQEWTLQPFWCTGWHSHQLSHLAGASLNIFFYCVYSRGMKYAYQTFGTLFWLWLFEPLPFQTFCSSRIYWMLIRCCNTRVDMMVLALMEFIPLGSRVDQVFDKNWNLGCVLKETIQGWQKEMKE